MLSSPLPPGGPYAAPGSATVRRGALTPQGFAVFRGKDTLLLSSPLPPGGPYAARAPPPCAAAP